MMIKLFESYNEIAEICNRYGIENWTINADGGIDVAGYVYLNQKKLTKLPLKFGRVTGYFNCSNNRLTTLKGAPNWVGGYFNCSFNNLTTLEGAPKEVGGGFSCRYNKLTTLEGCPREITGGFYCGYNNLTTLEGGPGRVSGDFYCVNNNLTTLEGAPREVGGHILISSNIFPRYFTRFMELNIWSQPIIKQILKWQDEYELWKDPNNFEKKFKWMMEDIQENDLPDIKIIFP